MLLNFVNLSGAVYLVNLSEWIPMGVVKEHNHKGHKVKHTKYTKINYSFGNMPSNSASSKTP